MLLLYVEEMYQHGKEGDFPTCIHEEYRQFIELVSERELKELGRCGLIDLILKPFETVKYKGASEFLSFEQIGIQQTVQLHYVGC